MKKGVSLFASAGVAETFLEEAGVKIVVANELVKSRADLYQEVFKNTKMIQGDILDKNIFEKIIKLSPGKVDFLIAGPPCQGVSVAGKNRNLSDMVKDHRNYLIQKIIDFVYIKYPDYVIIENVPAFLKLSLPYKGKLYQVVDLLKKHFEDKYTIEFKVFDSSEYGVPQTRKRLIIKMYKKGLKWSWPKKEKKITVKDAIGHLPSLKAGEISKIPWHFARKHNNRHVLWMEHTPTGKSAFENNKYYPIKENGEKIKGYQSTYRRIKWDEPAPTITMRNDAISSQRNVHPGRKLSNGKYSDARVLTPLELMLLTSLPEKWMIPKNTPEILIRQCIGESIPPVLIKKIVECIGK